MLMAHYEKHTSYPLVKTVLGVGHNNPLGDSQGTFFLLLSLFFFLSCLRKYNFSADVIHVMFALHLLIVSIHSSYGSES